jgi:hypothetical protein
MFFINEMKMQMQIETLKQLQENNYVLDELTKDYHLSKHYDPYRIVLDRKTDQEYEDLISQAKIKQQNLLNLLLSLNNL